MVGFDPVRCCYDKLSMLLYDFADDISPSDLALICIAFSLREFEGLSIGGALFDLSKSLSRLEDKL